MSFQFKAEELSYLNQFSCNFNPECLSIIFKNNLALIFKLEETSTMHNLTSFARVEFY